MEIDENAHVFTYTMKFDPITKELKKYVKTKNTHLYSDHKLIYSDTNIIIMPLDKISANVLYVLLNNAKNSIIITKKTDLNCINYRDNLVDFRCNMNISILQR